jgi:hypothetical protein
MLFIHLAFRDMILEKTKRFRVKNPRSGQTDGSFSQESKEDLRIEDIYLPRVLLTAPCEAKQLEPTGK